MKSYPKKGRLTRRSGLLIVLALVMVFSMLLPGCGASKTPIYGDAVTRTSK